MYPNSVALLSAHRARVLVSASCEIRMKRIPCIFFLTSGSKEYFDEERTTRTYTSNGSFDIFHTVLHTPLYKIYMYLCMCLRNRHISSLS